MTPDHYAILGVAPTAEPAVIRAAYLALMREYHPDRNASAAAVERAQAIGAAYKILGDFDRRQEYDWDRRRSREAAAAVAAAPRRRASVGLVAAGVIGLAAVGAVMLRSSPNIPPDRLPDIATSKSVDVPAPAKPRAAAKRKKAMVAAVEAPQVEAMKAERTKPAPSVVKMATVEPARPMAKAMVAPSRPLPKAVVAPVRPLPKPAVVVAKALPRLVVQPPTPPPSTDIATLDQFVMHYYGQSWRVGDAGKRVALARSRDGFVVRRGACLADDCKRAAYLKLQRDVSAIVEGGQPAR